MVVPGTNLDHIQMWARLGVKLEHPGTGEPSIGVRDILMFSMLNISSSSSFSSLLPNLKKGEVVHCLQDLGDRDSPPPKKKKNSPKLDRRSMA